MQVASDRHVECGATGLATVRHSDVTGSPEPPAWRRCVRRGLASCDSAGRVWSRGPGDGDGRVTSRGRHGDVTGTQHGGWGLVSAPPRPASGHGLFPCTWVRCWQSPWLPERGRAVWWSSARRRVRLRSWAFRWGGAALDPQYRGGASGANPCNHCRSIPDFLPTLGQSSCDMYVSLLLPRTVRTVASTIGSYSDK